MRNLAAELLAVVQHTSTDAACDGVDLSITSGWRSVRYQQSLLDVASAQYGSEAEARRWVNTPEKSTHVTGRAVDRCLAGDHVASRMLAYLPTRLTRHSPTESRSADLEAGSTSGGRAIESRVQNAKERAS